MDAHWYKTDVRGELWPLNLKWKSRLAHLTVKITVPLSSSVVFTPSYLAFGCFLPCFHKNSDTKDSSKAFSCKEQLPLPGRDGYPAPDGCWEYPEHKESGSAHADPGAGPRSRSSAGSDVTPHRQKAITSLITPDQANPTVTCESGRRWHAREKDEVHHN